MPATLRHFAVNADDVRRAKGFYENVFGWKLVPWGPPDYYQIEIDGVATGGLQQRYELVQGRRTNAFRPTFSVEDIHGVLAAVRANGATVLMQPYQIEGGPLVGYFEDTEGNVCGVAKYSQARDLGPPTLRHFAINADNVQRARAFYEKVFDWAFTPWGPPDFYQVKNAGVGLMGAMQQRRDLKSGVRTNAFESSFEVTDIRATLGRVTSNGGNVLMPPWRIEGVGDIGYFEDTEGNICGVAQYLPGLWP